MSDLLETGREAVRKNHWPEAVTSLSAAARDDNLSADDLTLLAEALWWTGQPDEAVEMFERSFGAYEGEARYPEAAIVGARLAYLAMRRLSMSIAGGWISRVERLLEGQPETVGHGWLKILYTAKALIVDNDLESALAHADDAIVIGRRFGVAGIQAQGMSFKGVAMVHSGDWRSGIKLIDEAAAVAVSGDLRSASDVYCNTIAVCRNLGDYGRAGEWTDKADRWMHAHSVGGYPGICQVHRAELKRLRGSWSEAEQDARKACVELERFHIMDGVGFAQYEIGEVRRRMGDFASAEEAFLRAYEYGHDAQPGFSLLMLNRGETEEAAKAIAAAIRRPEGATPLPATSDTLSRGHLLPAQVEIALEVGDTDIARRAVDELDEIAAHFESPTWTATALSCRGALELHEGHPDLAVEVLSRAWRTWQEIGLPYESAQARSLLGRARLAQGNEAAARMEFRAAASTFSQLGAAFDLRRLQQLTGDTTEGRRERVSKVFMFTDIVTSTDLIGLIGDAAWENLLHWHDRALRDAISKGGGEVVRHTGDGFFAAFDDPRAAIDCAVTIQRMLGAHRHQHGFAPWVRIGLHLAEATRESGGDYSGQGVHAAARVGALAEREEIVVSTTLLEAAGAIPYRVTEARSVSLKGITDPLQVRSVDWRVQHGE
ncbi:MAG: tetratricopeptide repeat protein [Acidimicrobiia bacterium]